jgi:hypothetical protein
LVMLRSSWTLSLNASSTMSPWSWLMVSFS